MTCRPHGERPGSRAVVSFHIRIIIRAGAHAWYPSGQSKERKGEWHMDARSRRHILMGTSVRDFGRGRPDSDAGANVSLAQLDQLLTRGQQAATAQWEAQVDTRTSSAQKKDLRRAMLIGPIAHLGQVGRLAAKENPELGKSFLVKPGVGTYLTFQTTARTMQAAAETHKEVLAKYGLSESVLEQFGQMLDQFDSALTLGSTGRTVHKGATLELRRVGIMIAQTVRVMDARNRQRFQDDPQALGSWLSARQVLGSPKGAGVPAPVDTGAADPPAGGEVRPAA